MRYFAALRTLVAGYAIPGWGFWIVGKPRFALTTVGGIIAVTLLFGWSRLVLSPHAYIVFACLIVVLLASSAIWSAVIDFRRNNRKSSPTNWKTAIVFAIVAGILFYPLKSFRSTLLGYDIYRLPALSMAPTLLRGDYVLADTWHYSESEIALGDVAVFIAPGADDILYVKRVVALPGDELSFEDDALIRNGQRVQEPDAIYSPASRRPGSSFPGIRVAEGEYFVLGDNRNNSRDSRFFGAVPRSGFIGKVVHIWYSSDDADGIRWDRFPMELD